MKKWNFLLYVHSILLLWFVLFVISLSIPDRGKTASMLAVGNALFLFINIPLGIFSLALTKKIDFHHKSFAIVLSILNILVGIVMWLFVVKLIQMP